MRLVRAGEYDSVVEAFAFEKQVQGSNRRKHQALMRNLLNRRAGG